ncbi:hypothetical protein [Streptomyces beigongshangae]|uniref:hypothetical protein n=1 Tax=Streptomyces beigongshangae TaxID=2841597 RepID=UPI001C84E588|nr:hypothetical protein [Streptomyces sp. REN17]
MSLRPFAATTLGCALIFGSTATFAEAASPAQTQAATAQACTPGGPISIIKGTNVNMRATPGGGWVGTAQNGDCVYWYEATSGPVVTCPNGQATNVWHNVFNYRISVRGWVSGCFL